MPTAGTALIRSSTSRCRKRMAQSLSPRGDMLTEDCDLKLHDSRDSGGGGKMLLQLLSHGSTALAGVACSASNSWCAWFATNLVVALGVVFGTIDVDQMCFLGVRNVVIENATERLFGLGLHSETMREVST